VHFAECGPLHCVDTISRTASTKLVFELQFISTQFPEKYLSRPHDRVWGRSHRAKGGVMYLQMSCF
jgi:hypothetical protein